MMHLFVADLHPEKGFNRDMFDHLLKLSKDYKIHALGDCTQFPNSYKSIPMDPIQGNHDSTKRLGEIDYIGNYMLIHGHQWDPGCEDLPGWMDKLRAGWKHLTGEASFTLGKRPITNFVTTTTAKYEADIFEISDAQWWAKVNIDDDVVVVLYGHKHSQFTFKLASGLEYINVGAGWRGQYVTMEDDGQFYFHSFA